MKIYRLRRSSNNHSCRKCRKGDATSSGLQWRREAPGCSWAHARWYAVESLAVTAPCWQNAQTPRRIHIYRSKIEHDAVASTSKLDRLSQVARDPYRVLCRVLPDAALAEHTIHLHRTVTPLRCAAPIPNPGPTRLALSVKFPPVQTAEQEFLFDLFIGFCYPLTICIFRLPSILFLRAFIIRWRHFYSHRKPC